MTEILNIITFFGTMLGVAFNMFRSVEFGDTGVSLLVVLIAIMTLDIIVWFIDMLISVGKYDPDAYSKEVHLK